MTLTDSGSREEGRRGFTSFEDWTIYEVDKRGTQTNGPKDKEIDDPEQGDSLER